MDKEHVVDVTHIRPVYFDVHYVTPLNVARCPRLQDLIYHPCRLSLIGLSSSCLPPSSALSASVIHFWAAVIGIHLSVVVTSMCEQSISVPSQNADFYVAVSVVLWCMESSFSPKWEFLVFGIPFPQIAVICPLLGLCHRRLEKPCLSCHELVYVSTNGELNRSVW